MISFSSQGLSEGCQEPGNVLDNYSPRLPQHLCARHRALQAAQVVGLFPRKHQPLLRHPVHLRDVSQDVQLRLSSKIHIIQVHYNLVRL